MTFISIALARRAAPWLWGVLAAGCLCRSHFGYGVGEMQLNHEGYTYVYRIVAFLDLLRAGYPFPQWVVDFREGLGSPYFGYYQPGFFYLASAFAAVLPMPLALGMTLGSLALLGYGAMFLIVRGRFGTAPGMLAGTTLLASPYAHTEIYGRGDLSEFTGMMLLAPALYGLTAWLDDGRWRHWLVLAAASGALVVAHPVAGLLGYGAVVVVTACWTAMGADRRRAAAAMGALVAGVGLAAFYVAPIALEWDLVRGSRLTEAFDYRKYFVTVADLLQLRPPPAVMPPVALGWIVPGLVALAVSTSLVTWPRLASGQRRPIASMVVLGAGTLWLMHPASAPLWEVFPLLAFLQFPWRALLVLTVTLAIVTGCLPRASRTIALVGLALQAHTLYVTLPGTPVARFPHPATARDIAARFVAPDAADEWLPAGATRFPPEAVPRAPVCEGCVVNGFERTAGRLRLRVTKTASSATVEVPHYFFPVGWTATVAERPVPIARSERGLMRIPIPASGPVDVRFATTPARRLGALVSGATLLALIFATLARGGRGRRAARGPDPAS